MQTAMRTEGKDKVLREQGILNPHPERVRDGLFQEHPFFDPCDLVQVRYEMVRRVLIEGAAVGATAAAFGYSRVTLTTLRKRFAAEGMAGLLPRGKGPRGGHKLTEEVMTYVWETLAREPELRTAALRERVQERFGFAVHGRSLERALVRERKKGGGP